MKMKTATHRVIAIRAAGMALALAAVEADRADASRYPYDPVCAWGRIANGRGMLKRCLTQAEAQALPAKTKSTRKPTSNASGAGAARWGNS